MYEGCFFFLELLDCPFFASASCGDVCFLPQNPYYTQRNTWVWDVAKILDLVSCLPFLYVKWIPSKPKIELKFEIKLKLGNPFLPVFLICIQNELQKKLEVSCKWDFIFKEENCVSSENVVSMLLKYLHGAVMILWKIREVLACLGFLGFKFKMRGPERLLVIRQTPVWPWLKLELACFTMSY